MIRLAYYPGCTATSICSELDLSTRRIAPALGIDLIDIPWNCCGAGTFGEFGGDFLLGMHARIFALCEEQGADLVTVCNTCLMALSRTNKAMRDDPATLERANGMLEGTGLTYSGNVKVRHLLWVLADDLGVAAISDKVRHPLDAIKVGPFYGCHILRPSYSLGWEGPEQPRSLHSLIETLGSSAVTYDGYEKCCGFHVLLSNEKAATAMVGLRIEAAIEQGADALVTPCPLCHVALDTYQHTAARNAGIQDPDYGMPILHMSQLIGLAMGMTGDEMGIGKHLVSTRRLRHKLGLSG